MAKANTYELEKANKVKCLVCDFEGTGYTLWYYPTFMNGDAEVEASFCESHKQEAKKRLHSLRLPLIAEQKRQDEREQIYEQKKSDELKTALKTLQDKGFEIKDLNNGYQYRINGKLDIFPTNRNYHDIKNNERGGYKNLVGFVNSFNF
jgi:hypothetical protein